MGHQGNLEHSNSLKRIEEQFLNFFNLSDNLLKFCSHEDNYFISSTAVSKGQGEELDARTILSSKGVEEYFADSSRDYSDAKRKNDKSKIKASKIHRFVSVPCPKLMAK